MWEEGRFPLHNKTDNGHRPGNGDIKTEALLLYLSQKYLKD